MEQFEGLVLSQDDETLRVIHKTFDECGVHGQTVGSVQDANELMKDRGFDLVVCDYDVTGVNRLVYSKSGSSWRGMLFALLSPEHVGKAQGQRVHFTLPKPVTHGLLGRCLRAAYSSMIHEKRTASRYPVEIYAAVAELRNCGQRSALTSPMVVNLSRSGMCLKTRELLPQESMVRVTFELPQDCGAITVDGTVVWSKSPGESGIQFKRLTAASQKCLTQWLETKLPREFATQ
jgi:hypothetical protein